MSDVDGLLAAIERVRDHVLREASGLDAALIHRRPSREGWSVAQIIEHLVLAESYGIAGLWRAADLARSGGGPLPLDPAVAARSVDEVFADLPSRVAAPDAVTPEADGRPVRYWMARLRAHSTLLAELGRELREVGLERVVFPHFVAGPLDGRQRLEFFRWHLERHLGQILRTMEEVSASA